MCLYALYCTPYGIVWGEVGLVLFALLSQKAFEGVLANWERGDAYSSIVRAANKATARYALAHAVLMLVMFRLMNICVNLAV
jgi:hypothetical protein